MKKTLLASTIAIAFGFVGQAWAQQTNTENGPGNDDLVIVDSLAAAAGGSLAASKSFNDSNILSPNTAVAASTLTGTVTGNVITGVGNNAINAGTTIGGAGGAGTGLGGAAGATSTQVSGPATATTVGTGGAALPTSTAVGGPATATGAAVSDDAIAASVAVVVDDGNATTDDADAVSAAINDSIAKGGPAKAKAIAYGGDVKGLAKAKSGDNKAKVVAKAGDGIGLGGNGGDGGAILVDAGTFDMSNNMLNVGQSAAGIMVTAQNTGLASSLQQSVNVQSNLKLGN